MAGKSRGWQWTIVGIVVVVAVFGLALALILRPSATEPAAAPGATATTAASPSDTISRESRRAIEACISAQTVLSMAVMTSSSQVDEAIAKCKRAQDELAADGSPRAKQVAVLISARVVDISAARLAWLGGRDEVAAAKLDTDGDAWAKQVRQAMG